MCGTPFLERVRRATSRALLLDYDGTLAPFTPDRTRAFPYREIPELVSQIMRHETRVVLISGRAATELLFSERDSPSSGNLGKSRFRTAVTRWIL